MASHCCLRPLRPLVGGDLQLWPVSRGSGRAQCAGGDVVPCKLGMTTAAGIWVADAIDLLSSAGHFLIAVVRTTVTL